MNASQPPKNSRKHLLQASIATLAGAILLFTPLNQWGIILVVLGPIFIVIGLLKSRK